MIEIIPTVVPNTFEEVATAIARYRSFSNMLHVDAADGTLAPNKTWLPAGEKLPEADVFLYEAHLMILKPAETGNMFAAAGAKRIVAHVESFDSEQEAEQMFDRWKMNGAKEIGIALLLATPLEALDPYIYLCDSVTLMSIATVGTQGIPFDERASGRVADLHARYPELIIEVDGGIGEDHLATLVRAGAERFTEGSTIAQSPDPADEYQKLMSIAETAI